MSRPVLDEQHLHPAIRQRVANLHSDVLAQVQAAIEQHAVVVVGMAGNPVVTRARKALDATGTPYAYLSYGSYLSEWRRRNVLKMWTGWPTFPMVFVHGVLLGGADDLRRCIDSGEFQTLLRA